MEDSARTLSGINIIAGIWLIIAPFVMHYHATGNIWQEVVFGAVIAVLGLARLFAPNVSWPSWANSIIGVWLIIAPWVIPATSVSARWNEVVTGIIVAVLAWSSAGITVNNHHQTHAQ